MTRHLVSSLLTTALLLPIQTQQQAVAEGFGDFSVPPPKSVPKPKPAQTQRAAPRRHQATSRSKPRTMNETLQWISGRRICRGGGQVCGRGATWPLQTQHDGDYFLETTVPSKYCSPLTMEIALDDRLLGTTRVSEPGQVDVYRLGHISSGTHRIEIRAVGSIGGCNSGTLESWGVDLVLSTDPGFRSRALDLVTGPTSPAPDETRP